MDLDEEEEDEDKLSESLDKVKKSRGVEERSMAAVIVQQR